MVSCKGSNKAFCNGFGVLPAFQLGNSPASVPLSRIGGPRHSRSRRVCPCRKVPATAEHKGDEHYAVGANCKAGDLLIGIDARLILAPTGRPRHVVRPATCSPHLCCSGAHLRLSRHNLAKRAVESGPTLPPYLRTQVNTVRTKARHANMKIKAKIKKKCQMLPLLRGRLPGWLPLPEPIPSPEQ